MSSRPTIYSEEDLGLANCAQIIVCNHLMGLKAGRLVRTKAAISLTLTVAMGARAAFSADLTLYGSEIYKNVVVVSVTENNTVIWDTEGQRTLANKNFWGKTREEYANPELFKLPSKITLTDGSVLKSAKVLWFDQNGLTVQAGDEQRRCLYKVLPPAISARYPFTDATRAEYNALYYKFQERNRVAQAEQAAREQAAAAQAESDRQRVIAAQEAARAEAANAEREDNVKKVVGAGVLLLLGAAIVHAMGSESDSSSSVSEEDEARARQDKAASDMFFYNRQREEREAQALKEKNEAEALRESRAKEQEELMSRPRRF